jgi:hypothetical protein
MEASMNLTRRASLLTLAALGAAATAPPVAAASAREGARQARDRQAILAMAGDFRVRFDFRETVSFLPDYQPLEPKLSGGHESVRVIADEPNFVSLQHLLVVEHEDEVHVIKHWRQDWTYEPRQMLVYAGRNRWELRNAAREEREGAWLQTVWQTDDSPRYGGVGRWEHQAGVSRWTSGMTLRPLARRDAIRHPPYDRYEAINRHALTPTGWVHEQDNSKIGERDGASVTFVHEVGLNTYTRFNEFPVARASTGPASAPPGTRRSRAGAASRWRRSRRTARSPARGSWAWPTASSRAPRQPRPRSPRRATSSPAQRAALRTQSRCMRPPSLLSKSSK